jgi:hypothetical protein
VWRSGATCSTANNSGTATSSQSRGYSRNSRMTTFMRRRMRPCRSRGNCAVR